MKQFLAILTGLVLLLSIEAQEADLNAFTKVGDNTPEFKIKTLDGKIINTKKLKGKVLYINFFTLSCPPCMKEMPEIDSKIWKDIKDDNFVVLAIGREHTNEELKAWKEKKGLSLPIAADTDRSVYKNFAKQMVPRHYIFKDGKIIYQHQGYDEKEFEKMLELIKEELKK